MIDEVARLGWLELERYCTTHSDRRVRDYVRALEVTEPVLWPYTGTVTPGFWHFEGGGKVQRHFFRPKDLKRN